MPLNVSRLSPMPRPADPKLWGSKGPGAGIRPVPNYADTTKSPAAGKIKFYRAWRSVSGATPIFSHRSSLPSLSRIDGRAHGTPFRISHSGPPGRNPRDGSARPGAPGCGSPGPRKRGRRAGATAVRPRPLPGPGFPISFLVRYFESFPGQIPLTEQKETDFPYDTYRKSVFLLSIMRRLRL